MITIFVLAISMYAAYWGVISVPDISLLRRLLTLETQSDASYWDSYMHNSWLASFRVVCALSILTRLGSMTQTSQDANGECEVKLILVPITKWHQEWQCTWRFALQASFIAPCYRLTQMLMYSVYLYLSSLPSWHLRIGPGEITLYFWLMALATRLVMIHSSICKP